MIQELNICEDCVYEALVYNEKYVPGTTIIYDWCEVEQRIDPATMQSDPNWIIFSRQGSHVVSMNKKQVKDLVKHLQTWLQTGNLFTPSQRRRAKKIETETREQRNKYAKISSHIDQY